MSVEIKFVEPTFSLMGRIARDMRQQDIDEVWASHHHAPIEALVEGWQQSKFSTIVLINGEPVVMLGLVVRDILSGVGVPWLLGTNGSLKYKREFITQVPRVIDDMLNICPMLYNYAHVKNTISIKWLKRIGFSFSEPQQHGPDDELFCKFQLRRI